MPSQTLNTATSATDLVVGGNITTGDVSIGDFVTTGALSSGVGITSGEMTVGFAPSRTTELIVGHQSSSGGVGIRTAGEVKVGGAPASTITIGDLQTTGSTTIGGAQISGTLNIGTNASRTGDISIGSVTNTGYINLETLTGNTNIATGDSYGGVYIGTNGNREIIIGKSGGTSSDTYVYAGYLYLIGGNSINITATDVDVNGDMDLSGSLIMSGKGTVTQGTSVTTNVTLNAPSGVITSFNGTFVTANLYSYTFTNSYITTSSVILVSIQGQDSVGPNTMLSVHTDNLAAGSCDIWIGNPWTANWTGSYKLHFIIL